jgi:hypothetical protein
LRIAALLLLAAIAATAAWEWTSPERSVAALRSAAEAGDTLAIRRLVNFDSLRINLRTDAHDRLRGAVGEDPGLMADLGIAMGGVVMDRAIESLVTPGAVARLAQDGSLDAEAEIDRTGVNSFIARFDHVDSDIPPLEFHRDGFRWKLVRIRITPADTNWRP